MTVEKKSTSRNKGCLIGVAVVLGLGLINVVFNDKKEDVNTVADNAPKEQLTTSTPTPASTATIQDNQTASEPATSWVYNEYKDKMTDKTIKMASVTSTNSLDFEFPYDGGSTGDLVIRQKGKSVDIYLQISKGQFITSVDGNTCGIRFDDKPMMRISYSEPSDYSSDLIFLGSESKVLAGLKSAKTTKIQVEFYNDGNRVLEFNTAGLKW